MLWPSTEEIQKGASGSRNHLRWGLKLNYWIHAVLDIFAQGKFREHISTSCAKADQRVFRSQGGRSQRISQPLEG
jgi:hypothetical protein